MLVARSLTSIKAQVQHSVLYSGTQGENACRRKVKGAAEPQDILCKIQYLVIIVQDAPSGLRTLDRLDQRYQSMWRHCISRRTTTATRLTLTV